MFISFFYFDFLFFVYFFFFFFSSRRRHTRWNCDWSSDVCSSDLELAQPDRAASVQLLRGVADLGTHAEDEAVREPDRRVDVDARRIDAARSEERRVGKECRSRWSAYH